MKLIHESSNNRPYTHSRRWRMKFNLSRFVTAKLYRNTEYDSTPAFSKLKGLFWLNKSNYRYDEYKVLSGSVYDPVNNLTSTVQVYYEKAVAAPPVFVPDPRYRGPYGLREIPAKIITHDIGNGESDYTLDKVIMDGQYDTKNYLVYQYKTTDPDPTLTIELRTTSYAGETPVLEMDLIKANYEAHPGANAIGNPWKSRMNTPGFNPASEDEIDNAGTAVTREALALVVPFSKYRRSRLTIETKQKLTTLKAIQVIATEYARKTYG